MLRRIGYSGVRRVVVELGRNIFEFFLMLLALTAGVAGLIQPTQVAPPPGEPILPVWGRIVWYGGLVLGALICMAGLTWPMPHGPRIEQAGLLVLIGSGLSYVVLALVAAAPTYAVTVAVFVGVLAVRIYYLYWEPRAIAAAVRLIQTEMDGAL